MSAGARGALRSSTARGTVNFRHTDQPVWRGSFDIHDARAQVGRRFGNGTAKQANRVIDAIVETANDWAEEIKVEGKAHELTQNVIKTLTKTLRKCMAERTGRTMATKAGAMRSEEDIAALMAEADFIRGEAEFFGTIPAEQWAALAHPGETLPPKARRWR